MLRKALHIIGVGLVIVACLFFVAGQTLDFLVFKAQQNAIRKEIKKQIKSGVDEKDLYVFEITPSLMKKITWIKHGKEFKLNGRFYDVVKRIFQNGKFVFKCINDFQESKLFSQLDNQTKKRLAQNDANDNYYKNLAKDFIKNIFISREAFHLFPKKINNSFGLINHFSAYYYKFTPPPKTLV